MKFFLIGGGTGGPNTPLLAVAERLFQIDKHSKFYLIGSRGGIQEKLLAAEKLPITYLRIPAGKWRRYFSVKNFLDIFVTSAGLLKSLYFIYRYRPDAVFGAGSFVQVPVVWAAYLLRIPILVHQQDLRVSLATRLTAPLASQITLSFSYTEKNLPYFSGFFAKVKKSKTVVTGNPVRRGILEGSQDEARKFFQLTDNLPTVLVMGGGGGSLFLNNLVINSLPELTQYVQIIHVTGGRMKNLKHQSFANYKAYDFLGAELAGAYAVADLVISRAGMATVTELSALGKPAIIVPLPDSPQEDNAGFLAYYKCACVATEDHLTSARLVELVRKNLWDGSVQQSLRKNIAKLMPRDADEQIAKILIKLAKKHDAK